MTKKRIRQVALQAFRGTVALLRLGRPVVLDDTGEDRLHPHRRRHLDLLAFVLASKPQARSRILDVGCGLGSLAVRLKQQGFEAVQGVDFLHPQALSAEGLHALDRYVQADLNVVGLAEFPAESCDIVVSSDVIEHLESPAFLLREMARVLVPGGALYLTYPNAFNLFERVVLLLTGNSTRYRTEVPGTHGHIAMLPDQVLVSLAARAGLAVADEGRGFCMFGNMIIMPARSFGPAWSFVRYVRLLKLPQRTS